MAEQELNPCVAIWLLLLLSLISFSVAIGVGTSHPVIHGISILWECALVIVVFFWVAWEKICD